MTTTRVSKKAEMVIKPKALVATLYTNAADEVVDQPKGNTFIFDEGVRDTTKISQDDNNTTTIENEFSDDPLLEIITLGAFKFESEIADIQKDVLVNFGNFIYDEVKKRIYAPGSYVKNYAKVDLVFENGTDAQGNTLYKSLCIPKLQLNSQMLAESMNSNIVRLKLAGTAKAIAITINGKTTKSAAYVNEVFEMPVADDEKPATT